MNERGEMKMKKIYTMLCQQEVGVNYYGDANNRKFANFDYKVHFPVVAYLSTIIEKDEKFKLIVLDSFSSEGSNRNYKILEDELNQYYPNQFEMVRLDVAFEHNQKGQISTFMKLYQTIEENDEIYFDITFGLKPTPMTAFVSCNYAQKFVKNVTISNLVYAHYNFEADEEYVQPIVDITSLFLLNNMLETLSKMNSSNPMGFLKSVFKVED